jgi:hypothetical protein
MRAEFQSIKWKEEDNLGDLRVAIANIKMHDK